MDILTHGILSVFRYGKTHHVYTTYDKKAHAASDGLEYLLCRESAQQVTLRDIVREVDTPLVAAKPISTLR